MATKTKAKKPDNEKLTHSVATAIAMVQANARAQRRNFVESLELALVLGVDPRKPNQAVRGAVTLPHGTGKEVRVAVFARGAEAEAALAAGASRVGAEDLMEDIMAGKIDFERLIATPDMMPLVGRVARVLGPRGLMPNPKLGTITKDTAPAVRASKGGQVQYRAFKDGQVLAGLGKVNFTHEQLMDNVRAFMLAISTSKPEGAKGKYMKQAYMSSSMGKGVPVTIATIDPSNGRFMLITQEEKAMLAREQAEQAAQEASAAAAAAAAAEAAAAASAEAAAAVAAEGAEHAEARSATAAA
ncbi:ribosomal protein L1-like protein, partial [Tribonema minus]